jgi:cytochrome c peroxidase
MSSAAHSWSPPKRRLTLVHREDQRRGKLGLALACLCALAIASSSGSAHGDATAATPASPTSSAFYARHFSRKPSARELTELGRQLFFEPALSASGKMACSSCHDPKHAFGPANAASVQRGGAKLDQLGVRAVPSLRYTQNIPAFSEHFTEDDQGIDQGPAGGHTWDGRADTVHDQARLPLLSPSEMANPSEAAVVEKLRQAPSAQRLRDTFGADVFADGALAFSGIILALEVFQQSPQDFYPYSSKYDRWLRHQVELTRQEERGLALFNAPQKGNCASCHPSQVRGGAFPAFSDFGFNALGVPRNPSIPANRDPRYHDYGLCGPLRESLSERKAYCGAFRAPSLRNVALRRSFFHNGVFHGLQQVVEFYVQRDLAPAKWYPRDARGRVQRYDDLAPEYQANVNRDPPFDRKPGDVPALSTAEIQDVVAFLRTLTDTDLLARASAGPKLDRR